MHGNLMSEGIQSHRLTGQKSLVREVRLRDEWLEDVESPEAFVKELQSAKTKADIFSFWQRLPDTVPRYSYHMEWDNVTAVPVTGYDEWLKNEVDSGTRRAVKKAAKKGIEVRLVPFDDSLLEGIADVFNESPMRQGKPMRHYGKTVEQLREEYLPTLDRTEFLGAFLEGRLIGFIMLVDAGSYANIAQIMSLKAHWDKAPNNALIAKAVEICGERGIPYLVYTKYYKQGVTEFKRRNGFRKYDLPRYYVPLTAKGKIALRLGLHREFKAYIPGRVEDSWLSLKKKYYALKSGEKGRQTQR